MNSCASIVTFMRNGLELSFSKFVEEQARKLLIFSVLLSLKMGDQYFSPSYPNTMCHLVFTFAFFGFFLLQSKNCLLWGLLAYHINLSLTKTFLLESVQPAIQLVLI